MARFRDLSIRSKLMTGFMLTSLVALLIMMGALAYYDRETFRNEAQADVNVLAGVIGENAASSLVFNDPETARSTLGALRAQPHISAAILFDRDGKLFASYMKPHAGALQPQHCARLPEHPAGLPERGRHGPHGGWERRRPCPALGHVHAVFHGR